MITLYPPILNNIPAFTQEGLFLTYKIPSVNNITNIQYVLVQVRKQRNNFLIYQNEFYVNNNLEIIVREKEFFESIDIGEYIKVQLRFIDFDGNQSELSNVSLGKYIQEPEIQLTNFTNNIVVNASGYKFYGEATNNSNEREEFYCFTLYDEENNKLDTSGWIIHDSSKTDYYVFNIELQDDEMYRVGYKIQTENGYVTNEKLYTFTQAGDAVAAGNNFRLSASSATHNITLHFTTTSTPFYNWFVIRRQKDGGSWEDIKYIFAEGTSFSYIDRDVEFGSCYCYTVSKEFYDGTRVQYGKIENLTPTFDHAYLYRDGQQLCLMFNPQITNYSSTVLDEEVQTIGGKYPIILRNGVTYYRKFNLSGTLSILGDEGNEFTLDKDIEDSFYGVTVVDYTDTAIQKERMFRDAVNDWLNDGTYKLFKSPTEGNIIVYCQKVILTPKTSLGRLITDFSMTLIEVEEYNVHNVDKYGIEPIGEYDLGKLHEEISFGQLLDLFEPNTNLYAKILEQQNDTEDYFKILYKINEMKIFSTPQNQYQINDNYISMPVVGMYKIQDVNSALYLGTIKGQVPSTSEVQYICTNKIESKVDSDLIGSQYIQQYKDFYQYVATTSTSNLIGSHIKVRISNIIGVPREKIDYLYIYWLEIEGLPGTVISIDNKDIVIGHTYKYRLEDLTTMPSIRLNEAVTAPIYFNICCKVGIKK